MRRLAPRPLAQAIAPATQGIAPPTTLARVQASWEQAVGPVVAAEAEPVSERSGALTVACRSSLWASELQLLAPDLVERVNAALGGPDPGPISSLKVRSDGRA